MKPNYQTVARKLDTAIDELPKADAPAYPGQLSEWIEDRPFSEIRAADFACREFSSTGGWPCMNNSVLAQIHLRLEAAADLCHGLHRQSYEIIPDEEEDLIQLLLIEYWRDRGPEWAKRKYDENC